MKFLVVCLLLLTCIVALSIQRSEGFFNAPASSTIPTRVVVTACITGNMVTFRARTTDNSTIQSAYLTYHSSKNAVAPEEFTDRIMGDMVTITPKETFIGNQPLSSMVIGKKYYAIQVTAPADTNAKKYQGNTVTTSRNKLLGVFTYSQPSACPMVLSSARAAPAASSATATAAAPAANALQARTFDRQEPASTAISDMSAQAKSLKQRMDILSDVQSLLKRKTLAKRRRPSKKKCCDCEDDCDCEDTCEKEEACPASDSCSPPDSCSKPAACPPPAARPKSAARPKPSMALSQGKEYKKGCEHDMSQYIRKDSIPCWNCNLDY
jgi:hypothetical protein